MQEYRVTVDYEGTIRWYQNGMRHRLGGPAEVRSDGGEVWYHEDVIHREGGPGLTTSNGTKYWYKKGVWHRLDGPAIEYACGDKSWYIDGVSFSETEFLKRTQPAKEMTVEEISKLLGYEVKVVKG